MDYLKSDRKVINDFSESNIANLYNKGYVFGRIEPGQMDQTTSLRINLENFSLTSENRRVLRKREELEFDELELPMSEEDYDWQIHKIGKDFYTTKFGDKTFSANKIKELIKSEHNFNKLLVYKQGGEILGYCICYESEEIIHYCYPFYKLSVDTSNLGMAMMLMAINYAYESDKKYIYLGSVQRDSDKYKLQFRELELFNIKTKDWDKITI